MLNTNEMITIKNLIRNELERFEEIKDLRLQYKHESDLLFDLQNIKFIECMSGELINEVKQKIKNVDEAMVKIQLRIQELNAK